MADAALTHNVPAIDAPAIYEPSLFGTYSKKIGMWLFLLSDSLTFGALLYAYSYGRISITNWPTPFHSGSIVNATIMTAFLLTSSLTMVLAVNAAARGDEKRTSYVAAGNHGLRHRVHRSSRARMEHLISEGLSLPIFPAVPGQEPSPNTPTYRRPFRNSRHFFYAHRNAHAARHAGRGLPRDCCAAKTIHSDSFPVLAGCVARTPAYSPFHYAAHVLLFAALVCSLILWLKPKVYDAADVEVAGLYWHFVDLVWMFIFPLVYLMSTKIV
jgi:cytochrome c oxidase subunit III